MTPTTFKIRQLDEQHRSNVVQEKLADTKNKIETAKVIVNGITGTLSSFLPFGLNLAKWKSANSEEVSAAVTALSKVRKGLKDKNGTLPAEYFRLLQALEKIKGGK